MAYTKCNWCGCYEHPMLPCDCRSPYRMAEKAEEDLKAIKKELLKDKDKK